MYIIIQIYLLKFGYLLKKLLLMVIISSRKIVIKILPALNGKESTVRIFVLLTSVY